MGRLYREGGKDAPRPWAGAALPYTPRPVIAVAAVRILFPLVIGAVCHAILYAWLFRAFPSLKPHRRRVGFLLAAVVLLFPLARVGVYKLDHALARPLTALLMAEGLALALALLPLLVVRLVAARLERKSTVPAAEQTATPGAGASLGDTASPSRAHDEAPTERGAESAGVSRRVLFERTAGLAILGASGGTVAHGALRGRLDFQLEEVVVRVRGLPRVLEGYTIAQVSDLHVGLFVQEAELARGLALVQRAKPDLVVATGDLVDFDGRYIGLMARALADLKAHAKDGVAAILGNHDYYTDGDDVTAGLRAAGVRTLVNEHVVLRPGDAGGIVLVGVDDIAGPRFTGPGPNLSLALRGAPDVPRILLAHQPQFFDDARGHVALQLSGHTHGGQVNPIVHPAKAVLRYVAGRYESAGSTLWVNRGFGTAGPPTRIGTPPEITKIVLVAG